MKMIDTKGRLFGFINILDLIVLALIIGLGAVFALRTATNETVTLIGANQTFYITFRIERVRDFSVAAVKEGDIIYEQYAQVLGKTVKVWTETPHEVVVLNDGTAEYFPMEGKYDLFITIEATGTSNSGGFYVNGNNQVSSGKDMKIQSNTIYTSARVFSVSEEMP